MNGEIEIQWFEIRYARAHGDEFEIRGCEENLSLMHHQALEQARPAWSGTIYKYEGGKLVGYSKSIDWSTVSGIEGAADPRAAPPEKLPALNESK